MEEGGKSPRQMREGRKEGIKSGRIEEELERCSAVANMLHSAGVT